MGEYLRRSVLVALACVLAACSGAAPLPVRNAIPYAELTSGPAPLPGQRIAYGPDSLQFGELRLPPGRGRVPIVVLIHGGCWRAFFGLGHVSHAAAAITRAGYATWTIEYRRIGDAGGGWPGTFADVARGVDYTTVLSSRFPRLDTKRLVLAGHSAGGQLALWAASRRRGERLDGVEVAVAPVRVAGVVSLAGITDLRAYGAGAGSCNKAITPLLGGTPHEFPDRYSAVSPSDRVPLGIPVRFIHGSADSIVPLSQSRSLLDRERAIGANARLSVIDSAGHFDLVAPISRAWLDVMGAIRALAARR